MHTDDPVAFNEEAGELSFGSLSRAVMKDTLKNEIDHVSEKYLLIPLYHQQLGEINDEVTRLV